MTSSFLRRGNTAFPLQMIAADGHQRTTIYLYDTQGKRRVPAGLGVAAADHKILILFVVVRCPR